MRTETTTVSRSQEEGSWGGRCFTDDVATWRVELLEGREKEVWPEHKGERLLLRFDHAVAQKHVCADDVMMSGYHSIRNCTLRTHYNGQTVLKVTWYITGNRNRQDTEI